MQEPRNTSSNIWSLGVVFLEMIIVLKGKTVEYLGFLIMTFVSDLSFPIQSKTSLLRSISLHSPSFLVDGIVY